MDESASHSNSVFSRRRAPQNSRSYMSMSHAIHQTPFHNNHDDTTPHQIGNTSHFSNTDNTNIIYGTNISHQQASNNLISFINEFETITDINGE